jgi:hypothetical protein
MSIELSKRAAKIIQTAVNRRAFAVQSVARLHYSDLLLQDGSGIKTINEIEEWLVWHGKTLRGPLRSLGAILLDMERRGARPPAGAIEIFRARLESESDEGKYAATQLIRVLGVRLNWQSVDARPEKQRQP